MNQRKKLGVKIALKEELTMNKKCKCGNTEFNKQGQCTYCVWKGDAGPGLLLKKNN